MKKVASLILKTALLFIVFVLGCYFSNFLLNHPILLVPLVVIELVLIIPLELESRKNNKNYYEKGRNNYEDF